MEQPGASVPSNPLSDKQRAVLQQYVQQIQGAQLAISQLLTMAWPEFDPKLHDYNPSTGTLCLKSDP